VDTMANGGNRLVPNTRYMRPEGFARRKRGLYSLYSCTFALAAEACILVANPCSLREDRMFVHMVVLEEMPSTSSPRSGAQGRKRGLMAKKYGRRWMKCDSKVQTLPASSRYCTLYCIVDFPT
jgi:hypothetical protein